MKNFNFVQLLIVKVFAGNQFFVRRLGRIRIPDEIY